jgi:hypothetical protein
VSCRREGALEVALSMSKGTLGRKVVAAFNR